MTTLNNIEAFLNLEIGDKKLKDGKKYNNKNQYYYYEQFYYIMKLSNDKWMIAEDCQKTRKLLKKHCWSTDTYGYARTHVDKSTTKIWHQIFYNYEGGLVADHINNKTFDNRLDNIRIVTTRENALNRTISSNNTSGKQGVIHFTYKMKGYHYWKVEIIDNNGKRIQKYFSIKKLGDAEAKRQAIECRKQLEIQYGYIGD